MTKAALDMDLMPRFSAWPARLLGLEPWEKKVKTPGEVTREYEHEKWGVFLKKAREGSGDVTVEDVDRWLMEGDRSDILCSIEDRLQLLPPMEARRGYVDLVSQILQKYQPASALVELGAGYGSLILTLAQQDPFARMRLLAGEYTASGVELTKMLALQQGTEIEAAHCDLGKEDICQLPIPENALIFTSYATHYVPILRSCFISALAAFKPRAVFHFEPCFEHFSEHSLLGLMRRAYMHANDYNTNLVTLIREHQDQGDLKIVEEQPLMYGMNPLLTTSILVWEPDQNNGDTQSPSHDAQSVP